MNFLHIIKKQGERGEVARLLLLLAVIVLVGGLVTYLVVKMATKPPKPIVQEEEKIVLPVYEYQLGNIRFVFQSALDKGNTLRASELINKDFTTQKDVTTTERFIIVTIGAQNKGTINTEQGGWDIGNIIDSDGRNFVPLDGYITNAWLPSTNGCGKLLKPAFNPTGCTKIYEVAKESKGLKMQVMTGANNNSANDYSANRRITYDLDLIVK